MLKFIFREKNIFFRETRKRIDSSLKSENEKRERTQLKDSFGVTMIDLLQEIDRPRREEEEGFTHTHTRQDKEKKSRQ